MPVISMFYGIIIRLYLIDNKQHNLPHIHAKYSEFEASITYIPHIADPISVEFISLPVKGLAVSAGGSQG